jgi:transposase
MLRVDAVWLSTEALDMRAGMDTLLSRVVLVFGAAKPHHAYLFANARGNRMKIFIQDGYGMWMCTRRLAEGTFSWPRDMRELKHALSVEQLQALVVGLPWARIGEKSVITSV